MIGKKKILQHELLSKMEGYNDEMKPKPIGPKVKALMIVILIILASTFGVYYMGEWNVIGMDLSHKADTNGNLDGVDTYVLGFLNTLVSFLVLCLVGLICVGLYTLYDKLVKEFS